jgi:hypothetical protein
MKNLEQVLLNIILEEEWTIRCFLCEQALKRKPYIEIFFKELIREIGEFWKAKYMIKSLNNYSNLYWFFNEHYREISNTLLEYTDEDEWFYLKWNALKCSVTWFAIEKIAKDTVINDLGLDS